MKHLFTSIFLIFAVLLAGCSKARTFEEAPFSDFSDEVESNASSSAAAPRLMSKMAVANDIAPDAFNGEADSAVPEFQRKLIYSGNITLEVSDLSKVQENIESWCKGLGGYIANSSCGQKSSNFTVKIPAEKFDDAMTTAGTFGTVKNKGVSTSDVSEEYYDLQGRLETRKVLREKLNGYLKQASNMQDMLKVERELNSVQSEIESMEGRMKRLNSQIDFATITIYANLPYSSNPEGGFQFPDFGDGFRHFVSNVISFFSGFIAVLLYAVIFGIPILAVIALLYWLLLGKVGLLIKLYNRLKK